MLSSLETYHCLRAGTLVFQEAMIHWPGLSRSLQYSTNQLVLLRTQFQEHSQAHSFQETFSTERPKFLIVCFLNTQILFPDSCTRLLSRSPSAAYTPQGVSLTEIVPCDLKRTNSGSSEESLILVGQSPRCKVKSLQIPGCGATSHVDVRYIRPYADKYLQARQ